MTTGRTADNPTPWIKASRSTAGSACVELRRHGAAVEVRDSKDPHGPTLQFSGAQFAAWLEAADGGEYAPLTD
jgi:hypothetical protein